MRTHWMVVVAVAATATLNLASAQPVVIDGTAAAIREVVAGKTCVGDGVIVFGDEGAFERKGRAKAAYSIGYGTILIRRGADVHGHVASVSVTDHMLYLSTGAYRCGG